VAEMNRTAKRLVGDDAVPGVFRIVVLSRCGPAVALIIVTGWLLFVDSLGMKSTYYANPHGLQHKQLKVRNSVIAAPCLGYCSC